MNVNSKVFILFVLSILPSLTPIFSSNPSSNDLVFKCGDAIYTADSNGGAGFQVTTPALWYDETPRWSPQGDRIVFGRDGEIWSVRPDGTDLVQITAGGWWKLEPAVSPDESKLLYVETDWWDYFQLRLANADGSSPVLVTHENREFTPDWSPDGTKFLVSHQFGMDGPSYIYVYNSDGSNPKPLTGGHDRFDYSPRWSPDGSKILFVRNIGTNSANPNIYVMNADGIDVTPLATTEAYEENPVWSPDGGSIVYSQEFNIWIMNADGTNKRPLGSGAGCSQPDWRAVESVFDVSGRVINSSGRGVSGIRMSLDDGAGNVRIATTSSFGYFQFLEVPPGNYTIRAKSKRNGSVSQLITVHENLFNLNIVLDGV